MHVLLVVHTALVLVINHAEGLTCLKCDGVPQPRICNKVVECYGGESCSVEKVLNNFGEYVYNLGCLSNMVCNNFTNSLHSPTITCSECCRSADLCNSKGCGEPGYPSQRGPICYNCPLHTDTGRCHDIGFCSHGEVCNIVGKNVFSDVVYTSRCVSKHACKATEAGHVSIIGKRDIVMGKRSHEQHTCDSCCSVDICNKNCSTARQNNDTDECSSNPCYNGGTCVDGVGNYSCACNGRFAGTHCELSNLVDCLDVLRYGGNTKDGIYTIRTWKSHQRINVYCDMTTDGGGWTVFQYRFNGSIDFYRNFSEYEHGFGNMKTEFWLGLRYIEELANQGSTDLRIDLEAANGTTGFETFGNFSLSPGPGYTLHVGSTIDSLRISSSYNFGPYHNGKKFTTKDHDVDSRGSRNCAVQYHGAWWYYDCYHGNLNGWYMTPGTNDNRSMNYSGFLPQSYSSLKSSKMMIRRK